MRRVVFEPDNDYVFFQDFAFLKGIPGDVEFAAHRDELEGRWVLVAPGYGAPEHYGNGAILIIKEWIPEGHPLWRLRDE